MARIEQPTVVKKYANRRLYNTGTSSYVTLEDLGDMVRRGEDFVVYDAKSGEDLTRSVLIQIIFEQESKGQNLLPVNFLRQLIRFYGDSMQALVPGYLDQSIQALTKEQDKIRTGMVQAFGPGAFGAMDEQIRRNTEVFERAVRMFMPFGQGGGLAAAVADPEPSKRQATPDRSGDIDFLKTQLEVMQKKLDQVLLSR